MIDTACRIEEDINANGLERYDPSDVLSHPIFKFTESGCLRPIWIGLRGIDLLFPIMLRKILKIRKTLSPTTLWHLMQSYLNILEAGYGLEFNAVEKLKKLCDLALAIAEDSTYLCWVHPYTIHGKTWKDKSIVKDKNYPMSCAHNTARLGLALLKAGSVINISPLVEAGLSAAQACITYHNWHWYENGKICGVSYYPITDDEVINTGAEMAILLSEAYVLSGNNLYAKHARGLFRLVISEQEADGGWRYCSKAHEQRLGLSSQPDNHHHAMVLRAMAICASRYPTLIDNINDVKQAIIKGVNYYIKNLSNENGFCFLISGKKREADIAGYCEGLLALQESYEYLVKVEPSIAHNIRGRRYAILNTLFDRFFLNYSNCVISARRFGLSYKIGSIRWGSGLMLEVISSELRNKI